MKTFSALNIALLLLLGTSAHARQSAATVFTGATVLDGTGSAIPNAVVVVRDGRIESIGAGSQTPRPAEARTVDVRGKFLMPGMITAHAHISDIDGLKPRAYTDANTLRQLGVFARYGVTSVWSLGGEQAPAFKARATQTSASLDRARIFLAGDIITGATPAAARAMVAKVAAGTPDIIKIRVDDNLGAAQKMTPAVYAAVIDEAHKHNLRVAAHIYYLDDAKGLLKAGVDVIAHSVRDKEIDAEFISLMKARDVAYCPTLTRELSTFVYEATPAFFADPFFTKEADPAVVAQLKEPARQAAMATSASAQTYKAQLPLAQRNLKKAIDAGITVVMGTDTGPFPERFQGYFEHVELEMMVQSGLTPAQALKSATGDAARGLKMKDIGTLAPGHWADIVVLDGDPRRDIRNTRSIADVYVAGNRIAR